MNASCSYDLHASLFDTAPTLIKDEIKYLFLIKAEYQIHRYLRNAGAECPNFVHSKGQAMKPRASFLLP